MTNHHRPRITRARRDTVIEAGKRLNGADVGFHEALGLLCRYLDMLNQEVSCPDCGTEAEVLNSGSYRCRACEADGDSPFFGAWDYLGTECPEDATLPGLPRGIKTRFGGEKKENSGTSTSQSTPDTRNGRTHTDKTGNTRSGSSF
jgi:hypothetical protein